MSGAPGTLDDWLSRIEGLHPKGIELGLERVGEVIRNGTGASGKLNPLTAQMN